MRVKYLAQEHNTMYPARAKSSSKNAWKMNLNPYSAVQIYEFHYIFVYCTDLWLFVHCRYDMANPRSGFFHGLLTRPSRILSISGTKNRADRNS